MSNQQIDRRQVLKGAALVGGFAALVPATAFADDREEREGIEGTWDFTITITEATFPPPLPPPFRGLGTFATGGGFIGTEQNTPTQLGSWVRKGEREFAFTFVTLFDPRNPGGSEKVRAEARLDESEQTLKGRFAADGFNAAGHKIFSAKGTFIARQLQVEPL